MNSNKKQLLIFLIIILFMLLIIAIYFLKSYNSKSDYETIESSNILENYLDNNSINTVENDNLIADDYIIIHITGAINNPGIVKLSIDSRISDAITSAGGFTPDADISSINLAYKLEDGQKIYIPYIDEFSDNSSADTYITTTPGDNVLVAETSDLSSSKSIDLININIATQTELETIPGIGPSTALRIIEYRSQNGKFVSIEDLKNVSGIGDAKFENIKSYITIK